MLSSAETPISPPAGRPIVSDVSDDSDGRHFTITFDPWQELPAHRNASRILITVTRGSGSCTISDGTAAPLATGDRVQVDPNVLHAVTAGEAGLEVTVHLVAGCCGVC